MTNQEILEKAIQKAIDGEYRPDGISDVTNWRPTTRSNQTWVRWLNDDGQEVIQDVEHVIFNHDFAKALWGEEEADSAVESRDKGIRFNQGKVPHMYSVRKHGWQYHLQQMVIADDPVQYLLEHSDEQD